MRGLCNYSCPGVIYVGALTLRETHRMIADSFALVSCAPAPKSCTPILEVRIDFRGFKGLLRGTNPVHAPVA